MKSKDKKIVSIVLAGVVIGSFAVNVSKAYAVEYIIDQSSGLQVPIIPLNEKFNPEKYPKQYPEIDVPSQFIYKIRDKKEVLPKGNDQGMERLLNALRGSGFSLIKVSGKQEVIDDFVEGLDIEMLNKSQVCFKDIDRFRQYISYLKVNKKPLEGVYRLMIGGFEGLFYFQPSMLYSMYDDVMIDLYYINRNQAKYKYLVLNHSLDGIPPIEKYKNPIKFENVEEFLLKISDFERRQVPGHFGSKNHGGVHYGGIYCIQIGQLVVLFKALA